MQKKQLVYLEDKWDDEYVKKLDEPEKLRYRSNLLGSDLRITNFGGGNTSSKIMMKDPLEDKQVEVLWVKGSGVDLGTITRKGFATLYMDKLLSLRKIYRGEKYEDEMPGLYPLCTFGLNTASASIETQLHGFITYKNIDHMHPDWAIAIADSANGRQLLEEFNNEFGYHLIWLPWRRPGYQHGLMLKEAFDNSPKAEGIVLAQHGLINWADGHYECYRRTLDIIDCMGQFVNSRIKKNENKLFGGQKYYSHEDRREIAGRIMPVLRGIIGAEKQVIGSYFDTPEVLRFVNSNEGEKMASRGTSTPDHFIRTKVKPMFVNWDPQNDNANEINKQILEAFPKYRKDYVDYYESNKEPDSPAIRGSNPTVVLIPGIGMFSFGKNKRESRIAGEFYINAISVMEGTTSMETGVTDKDVEPEMVYKNYVSLTPKEAFKIEYWSLEEAKLQRLPKEKEFSRKIAVIVGSGDVISRDFCLRLANEGAIIVAAGTDISYANETASLATSKYGSEAAAAVQIDVKDKQSIIDAFNKIVLEFGGVDILIYTGEFEHVAEIEKYHLENNKYILIEEFFNIIKRQNTGGAVLLASRGGATESAPDQRFELNNFIKKLSRQYSPRVRLNCVSHSLSERDKNKDIGKGMNSIVEAGCFLISEKACVITGQTLIL